MKKTLFLALALCCGMSAMADDTPYNVEAGKTVTATLSGSNNIIKEGAGTLQTSLNNNKDSNDFTGDVFVNAGTLELTNNSGNQAYIGATSNDGQGSHATVSVANGATLILREKTGISMPVANANVSGNKGFTTTIAGGSSLYAATQGKDYSWLQNVTVSEQSNGDTALISIAATDSSKPSELVTHSFSLIDTVAKDKAEIKNTTIHCNESYMSGHITIDNSVINNAHTLVMTDFSEQKSGATMKVQNHTVINLGGYDDSDYAYGLLQNVSIDSTSKVNALKNSKGTRSRIALLGANELHVKSKDEGGLATKTDVKCEHDHDGRLITYTTDQLSGCYLYDPYAGSEDTLPGTEEGDSQRMLTSLNVVLDDYLLPELNAHDHFTVTLVLLGLDASEVLANHMHQEGADHSTVDGWHILGSDSPVKLDISQYAGVITMDKDIGIQSVSDYNGTGETATLFRFSIEKKDSSVPEPATATLSLLALAGLAARRRRH